MLISDLTYIEEVVSEEANIEGGFLPCLPLPCFPQPCLPMPTGSVTINGSVPVSGGVSYIGLSLLADPCIKGNTASVVGGAQASGANTFTQYTPNAVVAPGFSSSSGSAYAASM